LPSIIFLFCEIVNLVPSIQARVRIIIALIKCIII